MQNHGYLEMTSPPWPDTKQVELSRGLTKNLAQSTEKSFPRRSNSSQPQTRPTVDTFNKYKSTGYSNPPKSQ